MTKADIENCLTSNLNVQIGSQAAKNETLVYVCGPCPMIQHVQEIFSSLEIDNLFYEKWWWLNISIHQLRIVLVFRLRCTPSSVLWFTNKCKIKNQKKLVYKSGISWRCQSTIFPFNYTVFPLIDRNFWREILSKNNSPESRSILSGGPETE